MLEFPLPTPSGPTNFINSEGLCYEAMEVKRCIMEGKLESETMPLSHTQMVSDIMKTVIKQIGSCIYDH